MDLSCHINSCSVRTINHADMRGAKVQVIARLAGQLFIARHFFGKKYIFQLYAFGKTKGNLCSKKMAQKHPFWPFCVIEPGNNLVMSRRKSAERAISKGYDPRKRAITHLLPDFEGHNPLIARISRFLTETSGFAVFYVYKHFLVNIQWCF